MYEEQYIGMSTSIDTELLELFEKCVSKIEDNMNRRPRDTKLRIYKNNCMYI